MSFTQQSAALKGELELQLWKRSAEQDLTRRGVLLCYCTAERLQVLLFTWTPDWQALCAFNINGYKKKCDILDLQSLPSYRFVKICTWSEARSKKRKSCQTCWNHKRFVSFGLDLTLMSFLQVSSKIWLQCARAFKLQAILSAQWGPTFLCDRNQKLQFSNILRENTISSLTPKMQS